MSTNQEQTVKVFTADPSALALFGLSMITFVASSQKLGITEGTSFLIPWAIMLGGLAQLIGCFGDFKRGNVFGGTAFGAYGFFWISMAFGWMIQNGVFGEALAKGVDAHQVGFAFIGFLIFSLFMTIGAAETHKVLFTLFALIDLLFLGLALYTFGIAPEFTHLMSGVVEFVISLVGFYACAAAVLNPHLGRVFLPVGKPFGIFKK
jgi:succinate-acetate transporter protein